MEKHLFLTALIVNAGLASVLPQNKISTDPHGIQENLHHLFDSIDKNDTKKTDTYRNFLEEETAREKQVFDTMKEEFRLTRQRNAQKQQNSNRKSGGADEKAIAFKREVNETCEFKNGCTLMKCSDPLSVYRPCGPYCTVIRVNNTLHLSGLLGIQKARDEYEGEKLGEGGIKHETEIIFKHIENILKKFNATYENIIQVRVYITNLEDLRAFNDLYAFYIRHPFPARTLVQVAGLPEGACVEVEVTAIISDEGRFETNDSSLDWDA